MSPEQKQENHICPACGTSNAEGALSQREYRCVQCKLELAHLDVAANGVIRGVFGWLHGEGDVIEERYRVKSVLGKGGFGATYLVDDIRLKGKRRALKEVPALLFDEYETTLLSRLNHPSIPDIIDRTEADGMVYLVLEFGGNRTLGGERKQYPKQRIPQEKLLPWIRQLCEVLIYLHSQDPPIVHRDLKPDNILLDQNDRIMLIDFGIAKESKPATMTRTLGRAATHGFSPPEQAMGTGTDERSDIYALAATCYALLTGENPPAAHERVAGTELKPPTQYVADISAELEQAILTALNLNVNRRQQTVLEFSQALDGIDAADWSPPDNNTAYTERTVMIGKTSASAAIHPPSLKLPSGRISTREASQPSSADTTSARETSKRNAIILVSGITGIVAVLLVLAYIFWPKSTPEPVPVEGGEAINAGSEAQPGTETAEDTQIRSVPAPAQLPAIGAGMKTETAKKTAPAKTSGSSALQELEKRWQQQDTPEQPAKSEPPANVDTTNSAQQVLEEDARRRREENRLAEEEARKRRDAQRRADDEARKRLEAQRRADEKARRRAEARIREAEEQRRAASQPATQPNTASPPAQDDWLKAFSNSQIRRK